MLNIEPFEKYSTEYELWFDKYNNVYESELLAIKTFVVVRAIK